MNSDNLVSPTPEEEAKVREALSKLEEIPGPEPLIWGGTDKDGWAQISIRIPPSSPVDARRLWIDIAEQVARHCERVGIPVEGGNPDGFRMILEERMVDDPREKR